MFDLHGVVPPIVTPLNADETVDEAGLERQLSRLIDAGMHGIFFLGSTGEQPALRDSERARALAVARRVAGGRIPLVVGTMAGSTARAIDNIRAAEAGGADAVAVTPPHYFPSRGPEDQLAHYRACAAATGLPVVVYNIPSTTKVMVAEDTVARIAEIPNVVGTKDSSADFTHVLKLIAHKREQPEWRVLVGIPPIAGAAILQGADGAVPGIANVCPKTMLDVYKYASAGDAAALTEPQRRVFRLIELVNLAAPIVVIKAALEMMGICRSHATAPFQPLSEDKKAQVRAILEELGLL
jgi:4-hydroxy-tetrahydrodipicolinate synthase